MILAAPPAVGSAAINDPMKGPLLSTTTEAVIAIFSASSYQKSWIGDRCYHGLANRRLTK
jgi:hypothetical protein